MKMQPIPLTLSNEVLEIVRDAARLVAGRIDVLLREGAAEPVAAPALGPVTTREKHPGTTEAELARREKVLDLWAASVEWTTPLIAKEVGITPRAVDSLIRRARAKGDKRAEQRGHIYRRSPARTNRVLEMYAARKPYEEIAAAVGLTENAASKIVARAHRRGDPRVPVLRRTERKPKPAADRLPTSWPIPPIIRILPAASPPAPPPSNAHVVPGKPVFDSPPGALLAFDKSLTLMAGKGGATRSITVPMAKVFRHMADGGTYDVGTLSKVSDIKPNELRTYLSSWAPRLLNLGVDLIHVGCDLYRLAPVGSDA